MGTCVCLLLLALALPQAAGGSNKRPGGPPGVRWREGDRDCTLTKGTDGVYRYSLSYETVTATLAVDSRTPGVGSVVAERRDRPETGDDDAAHDRH